MEAFGISVALSLQEQQMLQQKLLQVLARRTRLYTMDDSSSVPVETAQALFRSIQFLLELQLQKQGGGWQALLRTDLESALQQGIAAAQQKVKQAHALYEVACLMTPPLDNTYLTETLLEIGTFFRRYDVRYFAHQIPCMIVYPLNQPVSEETQGVCYVFEYLQRLLIEYRFLDRYAPDHCAVVLRGAYTDPGDLPLNLFEPVLANAIAAALLGKEGLLLTALELNRLHARLAAMPRKEIDDVLRRAAQLLAALHSNGADEAYLVQAAQQLKPYLEVALDQGKPAAVFTACPT